MYLNVPVDSARAVVGLLCDKESAAEPGTLSERSLADSQAEMGYGTTRPLERVMASSLSPCRVSSAASAVFLAFLVLGDKLVLASRDIDSWFIAERKISWRGSVWLTPFRFLAALRVRTC